MVNSVNSVNNSLKTRVRMLKKKILMNKINKRLTQNWRRWNMAAFSVTKEHERTSPSIILFVRNNRGNNRQSYKTTRILGMNEWLSDQHSIATNVDDNLKMYKY